MNLLHAGISVGVGVIALVIAALLRTVGRKAWPRLTVGLVIAGVTAIIGTPLGRSVRAMISTADGWLGGFIGQWTGTVVLGITGLVVVAVLIADLWPHKGGASAGTKGAGAKGAGRGNGGGGHGHKVTNRTLAYAAATPLAGATIPGTAGAIVMGVCAIWASIISWPLAWMFGAR
jgi:hypothetical protein